MTQPTQPSHNPTIIISYHNIYIYICAYNYSIYHYGFIIPHVRQCLCGRCRFNQFNQLFRVILQEVFARKLVFLLYTLAAFLFNVGQRTFLMVLSLLSRIKESVGLSLPAVTVTSNVGSTIVLGGIVMAFFP